MTMVYTTYTEAKSNGFVGTRAEFEDLRKRIEMRDKERERMLESRSARRKRLTRSDETE